jgi:hypothetical protein
MMVVHQYVQFKEVIHVILSRQYVYMTLLIINVVMASLNIQNFVMIKIYSIMMDVIVYATFNLIIHVQDHHQYAIK